MGIVSYGTKAAIEHKLHEHAVKRFDDTVRRLNSLNGTGTLDLGSKTQNLIESRTDRGYRLSIARKAAQGDPAASAIQKGMPPLGVYTGPMPPLAIPFAPSASAPTTRYAARTEVAARTRSEGATRSIVGGLTAAVGGIALGPVFGGMVASTGLLAVKSGFNARSESSRIVARGRAVDGLIADARGQSPALAQRGAYLDRGAQRQAAAQPAATRRPVAAPMTSRGGDGLTQAYVRIQNGRSVNVSAYSTPLR